MASPSHRDQLCLVERARATGSCQARGRGAPVAQLRRKGLPLLSDGLRHGSRYNNQFRRLMPQLVPNRHRGKLIVVEGIDGSGKSTQLSLLSQWLRSQRAAVAFSEWNSSPLVRETTRRGKKKNMFTPVTFSLIHATDFADRLERYITPLLKAGAVGCADRYAYTAFAPDVVRGVGRKWVRNLYKFAIRPDLAFYFRVPLEVAIGL